MESTVTKSKDKYWVTRLTLFNLEKPFHYKRDAENLRDKLADMTEWEVRSTYTLEPGHFFRTILQ